MPSSGHRRPRFTPGVNSDPVPRTRPFITFITFVLTTASVSAYYRKCKRSMKSRVEPYLKSQEVADVLGITKRTLMNWLRAQKVPEPDRNQANRYRRWTAQDVERIRQTIAENNSD